MTETSKTQSWVDVPRWDAYKWRADLDLLGVEWREYKGFPKCRFVITATTAQWQRITRFIQLHNLAVNS